MAWQYYPLTFRLLSPLRVGMREAGNLLETRPYVPGKTLWGALTARLTRDQGIGHQAGAYQNIGDILQRNMRFGYLWPSLEPPLPRYPWDDPQRFAYDFLGSYVSTALNYDQFSAEDGSLHEAEFIAPRTRGGEPVYLAGGLWVLDTFENHGWQNAIRQIQLGGERRYGWGRVSLENGLSPLAGAPIPDPGDFAWGEPVPAHLLALEDGRVDILGQVDVLLGWEMTSDGRKQTSRTPRAAYAPGAVFEIGNIQPHFRIGPDGVWEMHSLQEAANHGS